MKQAYTSQIAALIFEIARLVAPFPHAKQHTSGMFAVFWLEKEK